MLKSRFTIIGRVGCGFAALIAMILYHSLASNSGVHDEVMSDALIVIILSASYFLFKKVDIFIIYTALLFAFLHIPFSSTFQNFDYGLALLVFMTLFSAYTIFYVAMLIGMDRVFSKKEQTD